MKELIAFQGGSGIGEKGRPMGSTERSFEVPVGQTDQVRGVRDFVDIEYSYRL